MVYLALLLFGSLTGIIVFGCCETAGNADEQADLLLAGLRIERPGSPVTTTIREVVPSTPQTRPNRAFGALARN